MFLNKALSLPSSELDLVQTILQEAFDMHDMYNEQVAVRKQVLDVLQLNLQQSEEFVLERFGAVVDELLAHVVIPADKLFLAIGILREIGFDEEADLLRPAIWHRSLLICSVPELEERLRDIFHLHPASSDAERRNNEAAWRALEHLTFNARLGSRSAL
ncbi:hypothetical protein ACYCFK_09465 [Stutzerimonas stutzeri]